jgi:DNA-directed RNA polymerase specialized sigma24 family protein
LRLRYFDSHQVDDPIEKLDHRNRLLRLLASVCSDDRRMLLAVGFGHDSSAVARIVGIKPEAVRQRVARLRAKMACDGRR